MARNKKQDVTRFALVVFSVLAFAAYLLPVDPGPEAVPAVPGRKTDARVRASDSAFTPRRKFDEFGGYPQPTFKCSSDAPPAHLDRCWLGMSPGNHFESSPSADDPRECCAAVFGDRDRGLTLHHYMTRMWCTQYVYDFRKQLDAGEHKIPSPPTVMQIGANTGSNFNDHLFKFLKMGVADAVLLEPVPWVFELLSKTYKDHRDRIKLYNAAVSDKAEGTVTFQAPKKGAGGMLPQVGGLTIPPMSMAAIKKNGWEKYFEEIQVKSYTIKTLMESVGWTQMPDVVVVDTEGFDANVVRMLLAESARRQEENPGSRPIRMIQYEYKHLDKDVRTQLKTELAEHGYCVVQVRYDDIAIHESWGAALDMEASTSSSKVPLGKCARSYKLEKRL